MDLTKEIPRKMRARLLEIAVEKLFEIMWLNEKLKPLFCIRLAQSMQ